ncbi:alpha/beta hydrolase family protein [Aliarcobacter faecis]|uniref:alpha/beta hydrolase n=1 Tax=Aliarcobacter faecis TaxID=1564138 RepID=UPI00047943CB|nr:alpha/beta hydrolase family protein [Aliarcobacter faecis]
MKQNNERREFLKKSAVATTILVGASTMAFSNDSKADKKISDIWDKTFPKSNNVEHKKVSFTNRYGIKIVADLYVPKNIENKKLSALAIGGPFGAVKEQSSGLYAQTMAERGFITLAFDPSYTGESSGESRNLASPEISTEDFSAAVDFLGLQKNVNREKIGIIGICGWGGFALNAASVDKRIKAVATTVMYDMTRVMTKGYNDSTTFEQKEAFLNQLAEQRWKDVENGKPAYQLPYNKLAGGEAQFLVEYADYYMTPRGYHKRSVNSGNAWTMTTPLPFLNSKILTYIDEISPRPILIIAGEKAHSRYFSQTAFENAKEPKELIIVADAVHTDLYDKMDKIPFDKIVEFFSKNLK